MSVLFLISLLLAMVLGISAHRASVCSVRAVLEVLSARRVDMFISFARVALWVFAITAALTFVSGQARPQAALPVSLAGLLGGFTFGMGALLNRGCAFSTLSRLGDGDLSMLLSLAGIATGALVLTALGDPALLAPVAQLRVPGFSSDWWLQALAAVACAWCVYDLLRMWRSRTRTVAPWRWLLAEKYPLSAASALIGVCSAVLYAWHGRWAYTGVLQEEVTRLATGRAAALGIPAALFAAVILGIVISSWQRRSFHLRWRPRLAWVSNLAGGVLMGIGGLLAVGGNDVLLLHGIPLLSPHALPTYLAMIAGIALPMIVMTWVWGMPAMSVDRGAVAPRPDRAAPRGKPPRGDPRSQGAR